MEDSGYQEALAPFAGVMGGSSGVLGCCSSAIGKLILRWIICESFVIGMGDTVKESFFMTQMISQMTLGAGSVDELAIFESPPLKIFVVTTNLFEMMTEKSDATGLFFAFMGSASEEGIGSAFKNFPQVFSEAIAKAVVGIQIAHDIPGSLTVSQILRARHVKVMRRRVMMVLQESTLHGGSEFGMDPGIEIVPTSIVQEDEFDLIVMLNVQILS